MVTAAAVGAALLVIVDDAPVGEVAGLVTTEDNCLHHCTVKRTLAASFGRKAIRLAIKQQLACVPPLLYL